jgi:hypothetical protein
VPSEQGENVIVLWQGTRTALSRKENLKSVILKVDDGDDEEDELDNMLLDNDEFDDYLLSSVNHGSFTTQSDKWKKVDSFFYLSAGARK